MRFLHLADLHIGKQINGFSMVADQRHALGQILEMLNAHQVDALLLAGDIYDKAIPSEEAVRLVDWFLTEVSSLGVPILGIPGNHDSADRIAYAQSLLAQQKVYFPPVFDGEVQHVSLPDEHGEVHFWLLPYVRPIDVRRAFAQAEIGQDYTAAVKAVLDSCKIDTSERNVILSHQFVTAGSWSPERAAEELNIGGVDNVDVGAYEGFDYVALGHIHRPQRVGRDTVRYAGSLLKYSFSEVNYPKSAVLVTMEDKLDDDEWVKVELLPIEPLHDMREISGQLEQLLLPEIADEADKEDYLRIVLTDDVPRLDALARARQVYPNVMSLDYENRGEDGDANAAAITIDPKELSPEELFVQFFSEQAGHDLDEEQLNLVRTYLARCSEEAKEAGR